MDELKKRFSEILTKLDIPEKQKEIRELERQAQDPLLWQDRKKAAEKMKSLAVLQKEVDRVAMIQELIEHSQEEKAKSLLDELEDLLFFSGPYDSGSAVLSIHSGQGGVEAMDWVEMLYRMYSRFFEKKSFGFEILEETPGDEAGIKSIVLEVNGDYAYGFLKGEAGVHRLVRQSPFNADNLRQTSFALVEVMPAEIGDNSDIQIKDEDLEWDFFRSGGHGGQNVNKVSTAVRLKHIPSGIVISSQKQRYQAQNRDYALKMLKAKLWFLQQEKLKKKEQDLKGVYKMPGWGNQIRSYVLHPYKMVKDLRTGYETSDAEGVLNGNIDRFVEEELKKLSF